MNTHTFYVLHYWLMRLSKILAKSAQGVKNTTEVTPTYSAEWFSTNFPSVLCSRTLNLHVTREVQSIYLPRWRRGTLDIHRKIYYRSCNKHKGEATKTSGNGRLPCSLTSHLGNLIFFIGFNLFIYVVSSKPKPTKMTEHCSASYVSQYLKRAPSLIHKLMAFGCLIRL